MVERLAICQDQCAIKFAGLFMIDRNELIGMIGGAVTFTIIVFLCATVFN